MNEPILTPRALKIIKIQRIILLATVFGVPYGVYRVLDDMAYTPSSWLWIPFAIGSFFAVRLVFKTLLFFAVLLVYRFDLNLMKEESEAMFVPQSNEPPPAPREELTLTITATSGDPIGKYYDEDIFEWIEFTDEQGQLKFARFEDTINPKQMETYVLEDEQVLFPPGILYKLEQKPVENAG